MLLQLERAGDLITGLIWITIRESGKAVLYYKLNDKVSQMWYFRRQIERKYN